MKLVSWNVNGFQARLEENFIDIFNNMNADFFCIQEIKIQLEQTDLKIEGYYKYWNSAIKKGYSGTAIFTKHKPLKVWFGFSENDEDKEGRIITLEYEEYFLVNIYAPSSKRNLERHNFTIEWYEEFNEYIEKLTRKKNIIICGDFNVAHQEIDFGNMNREIKAFTDELREQFENLLQLGLVDTFRQKRPNIRKYTWWKNNKRDTKDGGCRLDYFLISEEMKNNLVDAQIRNDIGGADHCPIVLKIKI